MAVVLASVAFWATVDYRIVGDDGAPEAVPCRARFRRLKTSERRALDRRIRANTLSPDVRAAILEKLSAADAPYTARERAEIEADLAAEPITDAEFLDAVLVDWELRDRNGEPIVYSKSARAEVCEEWDGFEAALVRAYGEAIKRFDSAREQEKNSAAPSGTGC